MWLAADHGRADKARADADEPDAVAAQVEVVAEAPER